MSTENERAAVFQAVDLWNQAYGDRLPVSGDLLDATFFSLPPSQRLVLQNSRFCFLLKRDGGDLRIHLPILFCDEARREAMELVDGELKRLGASSIFFGGGDRHLFPGIPKLRNLSQWLEYFSPRGPEVMDFVGDLNELKTGQVGCAEICHLRNAQNRQEENAVIEFVAREFPGRWYREILVDSNENFMEHYFGYFRGEKVVGYARLYGWRRDYWAPGVYFSGPAKGTGGLGPIGIASDFRGRGLGRKFLDLSWKILRDHGCSAVRVDWTTEGSFYERAGLKVAEVYQPAWRK